MATEKKDQAEKVTVTQKEKALTHEERKLEISVALQRILDLCQLEPMASIICSIGVPLKDIESNDGYDLELISAYVGDTVSQVQQINSMVENNPQFLNDLSMFLDIRVKRQMEKAGTTGSKTADQLLTELNSDDLVN